ncbi:MAG: hypothetical protein DMG83_10220 [Acidobacteria bacterium]|nr:MAG: hypothetical protein DMG83_10220 [Acidobacteriota bacterium]
MRKTSAKKRHGAICGATGGFPQTGWVANTTKQAGPRFVAQTFFEQLQNYRIVLMASGWTPGYRIRPTSLGGRPFRLVKERRGRGARAT